jgi:hypothetical protein
VRTQTSRDRGPDHVLIWRREQLVRSGFPLVLATRVASDGGYDLHALIELLGHGCTPELAVRILAPIEGDTAIALDTAVATSGGTGDDEREAVPAFRRPER